MDTPHAPPKNTESIADGSRPTREPTLIEIPHDHHRLVWKLMLPFLAYFAVTLTNDAIETHKVFDWIGATALIGVSILFLWKLLMDPSKTRIDLSTGDVLQIRGWPLCSEHSRLRLSDYRRVYAVDPGHGGHHELNVGVIDHLGREKVIVSGYSKEKALNLCAQISHHTGLVNDALIL